MKRSALERLAWLALFWALVSAVQWRSGAYSMETVRHSDESAHLLNSVMVRDYLVLGLGENPLEFVKRYYLHYPAVAPLVWPPLFHVAAGVWMLVFGASATSAMVFVGLTGALALFLFFELSRREFGAAAGLIMALTLGGLALFIDLATSIMLDMPVLAASLAFTWWLTQMVEEPEGRAWLGCGIAGGLWGAVKANGLAALPSLGAALLVWRGPRPQWGRVARTAAIVSLLSLPPALVSIALLRGHQPPQQQGLEGIARRVTFYGDNARWQLGWWVLMLAGVGIAAFTLRKDRSNALDVAMIGTLAGTAAFHVLLPLEHNERYLSPMLPPLLYFAVRASGLVRWRQAPLAAACVVAALVLVPRFGVPTQSPAGWREAAARLRAGDPRPRRVMVFSEERGETAFTAEMALSAGHRADFVMRGSKAAAESNWFGGDYKLLADSPEELAALIEDYGIEEVIVDRSNESASRAEVAMVKETATRMPAEFPLEAAVDGARHITIHRVVKRADPPRKRISYDVSRSLNLTVSEAGAQER